MVQSRGGEGRRQAAVAYRAGALGEGAQRREAGACRAEVVTKTRKRVGPL